MARVAKPAKNSAEDTQIRKGLALLLTGLTHSTEGYRRQTFVAVKSMPDPACADVVIARLIGLLATATGCDRQQAIASLVDFGERVLPLLTMRFIGTRSRAIQLGIIDVLDSIGPRLDNSNQIALTFEIMTFRLLF